MPRSRFAAVAAVMLVVLVVVGCSDGAISSPSAGGSSQPSPPTVAIVHGTGRADLVLRYEQVGGFVAPTALLTRYPIVSIYGDGTVITEGPQDAIFPGPLLPNLISTKISEAGLQRILARARAAGLLGPDGQFDAVGIADAATAQFTVVAEGTTHVVSAYALGESTDEHGIDQVVGAARARVRAFLARLNDLPGTLGDELLGPEAAFTVSAARLFVTPGAPEVGGPGPQPAIAWPLATRLGQFGGPLAVAGPGTRCGVVQGDEMATLLPLMKRANEATPWADGNRQFAIQVRVLLPDEQGCPAA